VSAGGVQGKLRSDRAGWGSGRALCLIPPVGPAGLLSRQCSGRALYRPLSCINGQHFRFLLRLPLSERGATPLHLLGVDAVVPTTSRGYKPLFALYLENCLGPMKLLLESGNFCVHYFFPQVLVRYVSSKELAHFDEVERSFMNVNTPEEFARIVREISA